MADIQAKVVKKNPDGSLVVQLPGGGTRVVQAHAVQRVTSPTSDRTVGDPRALEREVDANTKNKKTAERHSIVDNLIDTLPTAVSTGMSMAGGMKKTLPGLGLAAMGGAAGEGARELLGRMLYTDPARIAALPGNHPGTTAHPALEMNEEILKHMGTEAAEQGGAELLGRGVGGAVEKIAGKLGITKAAQSAVEAAAGKGVQKTPGEASGNKAMMFLEDALSHVPGAINPSARFAEKRAAQTSAELARQLDAISTQKLTKEASGKAIDETIDRMAKEAKNEANSVYNALKPPLELAEDATRDEIKAAAEAAAKPHPGKVLGPDGKPVMVPGDGGKALRDLRMADAAYGKSQAKVESNVVQKIIRADRPEAVHSYVSKASLGDLRRLIPELPIADRQAIGRSIVEDAMRAGTDAETGKVSVRTMMNKLAQLDKDGPKLKLILGPQEETLRAALKDMAKIEHSLPFGDARASKAMMYTLETIALGSLGIMGGPERVAELVGGGMPAMRILSEAITNPEASRKFLTGLRRAAQAGVRVGIPAGLDIYNGSNVPVVDDPSLYRKADPIAATVAQGVRR